METGSITDHIPQLRAGDPEAVRRVWDCYFGPLMELARRRIMGLPGWSTDSEDVALSAFKSFCRALTVEQFPRLADRHDLWQALVVILNRKACDHARRVRRAQRGGSAPLGTDEQVQDPRPSPQEEAAVADELRSLLESLEEPQLQQVALLKLADCTNQEIAKRLGCGLRTVERKLERIRRIWEERDPG